MNIDKKRLKMGLWYEGKDGEFIPHNDSIDPPENAYTYHSCFPLSLEENVYIIRDGNGETINAPIGDRRLFTGHINIGGGNSDVILAMANSGDYTLPEAITVFGFACERCANVLAYKYLKGKDGYPEHSKQWNQCNTKCDFCRYETQGE